jgi:hypothetical protein
VGTRPDDIDRGSRTGPVDGARAPCSAPATKSSVAPCCRTPQARCVGWVSTMGGAEQSADPWPAGRQTI